MVDSSRSVVLPFKCSENLSFQSSFLSNRYNPHTNLVSRPSTSNQSNRKRKLGSDEEMSEGEIEGKRMKQDGTHHIKKYTLKRLLEPLDKSQLMDIISKIFEQNSQLEENMEEYLPKPSFQNVTQHLCQLEKQFFESFPYNKQGLGKDGYTFHRVRPQLMELKNCVTEYIEFFLQNEEHLDSVIHYLDWVTQLLYRLPDWEMEQHNKVKMDLFDRVVDGWKKVIDQSMQKIQEGKLFGHLVLTDWYKSLLHHQQQTNGLFDQVVQQFQNKLGWLVEIQDLHRLSLH